VFVAPAVWGLFGGASATFLLGVYQDAGLLLAGVISVAAMAFWAQARASSVAGETRLATTP
jgi:hypothetical protein